MKMECSIVCHRKCEKWGFQVWGIYQARGNQMPHMVGTCGVSFISTTMVKRLNFDSREGFFNR
jgi:hypothetical protein